MRNKHTAMKRRRGYTLIEVLVASSIGILALAGIMSAYIFNLRSVDDASSWANADRGAATALDRMVRGTPGCKGLRRFYINDIVYTNSAHGWLIADSITNGYRYVDVDDAIYDLRGNVIAENVTDASIDIDRNRITAFIEVEFNKAKGQTRRRFSTVIQARNKTRTY